LQVSTLSLHDALPIGVEGENTIAMVAGDGEHGAAGICYGAAVAGGRVFNATSANGYLYALEQMPVQSGTRMPMVLDLVTRSVSGDRKSTRLNSSHVKI